MMECEKMLDKLEDIDMETVFNEMLNETIENENKEFELIKDKYKDMFNAIIFNGSTWMSDQNLYSGLEAFQEIDNLVYIVSTYTISYLENKDINVRDYTDCFETYRCYIEYDNNVFEIEKAYGQGSFARITLLEDDIEYDKNKCAKIKEVIDWMTNTDKWRMFQNIEK
jgi:hypothetical protein